MKTGQFRHWVNQKYLEYRNEIWEYGGAPCQETAKEYFQRNKYFLKRMFKKTT